MLKKLNGIDWMTGTSEDSLYPCVMRDEATGVRIGLRIDVAKNPNDSNEAMLVFYMRAQQFDADGKDAPLNYADLVDALKGVEVRLTSPIHASNAVMTGILKGLDSNISQITDHVAKTYVDIITQVASKNDLIKLKDDLLDQIARERFLAQTGNGGGIVTEAEVEQKLDGKFDFTKMLKKGGETA